jgi:hypothetical protein
MIHYGRFISYHVDGKDTRFLVLTLIEPATIEFVKTRDANNRYKKYIGLYEFMNGLQITHTSTYTNDIRIEYEYL